MQLTSIICSMLKNAQTLLQPVFDRCASFIFWNPGEPANLPHKFTPAAEQDENMEDRIIR